MNWISHMWEARFSPECFFSNQELPTNESPSGSVKITLNLSEIVAGYGPHGEATNFSTRNFSVFYLYHTPGDHSDRLPFFPPSYVFLPGKKTCRFSYQITSIHIGMFSKLLEHSLQTELWSNCCHLPEIWRATNKTSGGYIILNTMNVCWLVQKWENLQRRKQKYHDPLNSMGSLWNTTQPR